ncbi:MAG: zinc ribbon domain-containing protein [Chloroflexi bacterium]|nr:zinc ribbon domain-containing protein [Chloroflexota bacterium]
MPIYEYRCDNCGEHVEIRCQQGEATPICPHCGGSRLTRVFSAPYLISGRMHREAGKTCCGREERCVTPPCSVEGSCQRG